jgi:hypothetical protein
MGETCDKYIWEDINIFFQSYYVSCSKYKCVTNIVNHVVFALVILIIIGSIVSTTTKSKTPLLLCLFLASLHAVYWYFNYMRESKETVKEKFTLASIPNFPEIPSVPKSPDGILEEIIGQTSTYPTAKNPFMNVLVDEIKYNPSRPPAASMNEPAVSTSLDDFFHTQFVNDPTDVFGRSQSQRQFYTTPSTTVPNDQGSYQDWLYKIPGKTCKEGGREACSMQSGSAGGAIPWLTSN